MIFDRRWEGGFVPDCVEDDVGDRVFEWAVAMSSLEQAAVVAGLEVVGGQDGERLQVEAMDGVEENPPE